MTFQSSSLKKNRVYAPVITGIALLLVVFAAKPAFHSYSEATLALASAKAAEETAKETEEKLRAQAESTQNNPELARDIEKIKKEFSESDILQAILINNFTRVNAASTATTAPVVVSQVSLNPGNKLPNGLHYGTVQITLNSHSVNEVIRYLTYLTTDAPFAFTIGDITLPIDTNQAQVVGTISVPVTLGIYYYK